MTQHNVLHAQNPVLAEYTICGLAFDAYESGDADCDVRFAAGSETVTCMDCRRAVIEARKIRLGRLRPPGAAGRASST